MTSGAGGQVRLSPIRNASSLAVSSAQTVQRLHREALPRVREAALAWRNGLAGLLAALLGFGLIRGRSDVSALAAPWNAAVGVLLLAALAAGAYGTLRLLWAAHGRPQSVGQHAVGPGVAADVLEARQAARALTAGIRMSLCCAALLAAAVAVTWYGPETTAPAVQVNLPGQTLCGAILSAGHGSLTLSGAAGEQVIPMGAITGIEAVSSCDAGA